jgi:hypothetical protein
MILRFRRIYLSVLDWIFEIFQAPKERSEDKRFVNRKEGNNLNKWLYSNYVRLKIIYL